MSAKRKVNQVSKLHEELNIGYCLKECKDFIVDHIDEHRILVLKQASLNTLRNYEKHVNQSSKRTRVWIDGTMQDRS
ncbi:unnamed protein product [Cunninghamella blakesleeana]